jgi:predicted ferric reductase
LLYRGSRYESSVLDSMSDEDTRGHWWSIFFILLVLLIWVNDFLGKFLKIWFLPCLTCVSGSLKIFEDLSGDYFGRGQSHWFKLTPVRCLWLRFRYLWKGISHRLTLFIYFFIFYHKLDRLLSSLLLLWAFFVCVQFQSDELFKLITIKSFFFLSLVLFHDQRVLERLLIASLGHPQMDWSSPNCFI